MNLTTEQLDELKFDEAGLKETLSKVIHVTCEDWCDTGYVLGRARGWNDCIEEIKKLTEEKRK